MVRERCYFYRPAGNVERAEIRIGEFVFKHQAPVPVEPNIHARERFYSWAVQLIFLMKCAADIRLDMRDRGAESDARVGLQMAEEIFAALSGEPAVDDVAESVIEPVRKAERLDRVADPFIVVYAHATALPRDRHRIACVGIHLHVKKFRSETPMG